MREACALDLGRLGLSGKALDLLRAGCADPGGKPNALRRDDERFHRELQELRVKGFLRWVGGTPWITPEGRAAIGAPSEAQVTVQRFLEQNPHCRRKPNAPPAPVPTDMHGRTISHYRDMKTLGLFCVPLFRHKAGAVIELSRDGGPGNHVYLKAEKVFEQPESRGDMLLAAISSKVAWGIRTHQHVDLKSVPPALHPSVEWTPGDLKTWRDLCVKARSINTRIQNPRRRDALATTYGATA